MCKSLSWGCVMAPGSRVRESKAKDPARVLGEGTRVSGVEGSVPEG